MKYIKRIDGLRGVSVLAVLFYHLNFPLFHGGFIGVDIFFVISGFLITGIIQSSLDNGSFSVLSFYERRIKRLLPALYLVLFVMAGLGFLLFLPHEIKDIYQAIVATTTYLSNVFNYVETDYFNTFYAKSPLLHTWSLSVEEQFYLVYPILLFLIRKLSLQKQIGILFIITVTSFIAAAYYAHIDKLYAFYYPWFRAWELGIGGLTCLCSKNKMFAIKENSTGSNILYHTSILVIILSIVFCRVDFYVPSYGTLPAVIASCIVLAFRSNKVYKDVLETRLLVFTGLISYSLYLWHQPVLSVIYRFDDQLGIISIELALIFSLLLGYLSWKFIETPFRHLKISRPVLWGGMITLSITLVAVGLAGHVSDGFMKYFISKMPKEGKGWMVPKDLVFAKRDKVWKELLTSNYADENISDLDYLIIGDSKGEDIMTSFALNDSIKAKYKFHYTRMDDEDMGMMAGNLMKGVNESLVAEDKKYSYRLISKLDSLNIKNIIISCTWQDKSNEGAVRLIDALSRKAKKTFVVSTANWNDVTSLSFKLARSNMSDHEVRSFLFKNLRQDWMRQSENLHTLLKNNSNVTWVYKERAFCNEEKGESMLFDKNKAAYIYDSGHLTIVGALYLGKFVFENKWFDME